MRQSITFYNNPEDIVKSYANSQVEHTNTWENWHILPTSRPVFVPPEVKENYIDIPGGNGALDLSEALTKYPTYNNRTGSFEFRVMNHYEKDGKLVLESKRIDRWAERYSEIMEYLHGRCLYAVLDDDPLWFYQGRFSVDEWKSDDTWSVITIGYNVNPFKWSITSSTGPWLWDPFNFETGIIWDATCSDIVINSPNGFTEMLFPPYVRDENSMKQFWGGVPISPTLIVESDKGIEIRFVNEYLGIDISQIFKTGTTFAPDFIFYGQTTPYKLYFKGAGKVSIDFRIGRL